MKKTSKPISPNLPDHIICHLGQLPGAPFVHLDTFCIANDGLFTELTEVSVLGGRVRTQKQFGLKTISGYTVGIVLVLRGINSGEWNIQELWQRDNSVDYYDDKMTESGHAGLLASVVVEASYLHHPPYWQRDSGSEPVWPTMNHQLMTFVEQLEVPLSVDERFRPFGGSYYFFADKNSKGQLVFKLINQSC